MTIALAAVVIPLTGCGSEPERIEEPHCEQTESLVGVDDPSVFGLTPRELIGAAAGEHTCDWSWVDASPIAAVTPGPAELTAKVTLTLTEEPARMVTGELVGGEPGHLPVCSSVTAPTMLTLETSDGALRAEFRLPVVFEYEKSGLARVEIGEHQPPGHRVDWRPGWTGYPPRFDVALDSTGFVLGYVLLIAEYTDGTVDTAYSLSFQCTDPSSREL